MTRFLILSVSISRVLLSCNSKLRSLTILGSNSQSSTNQRAKRAPPLLDSDANKEVKPVDNNQAQLSNSQQKPQQSQSADKVEISSSKKDQPKSLDEANKAAKSAELQPKELSNEEVPKQQKQPMAQPEAQKPQPGVLDDSDDQDMPGPYPGEQPAGDPVADNVPVAQSKKDANLGPGGGAADAPKEGKCDTTNWIEMKRSGTGNDLEFSFHVSDHHWLTWTA